MDQKDTSLPPEVLVNALQDKVSIQSDKKVRVAKSTKTKEQVTNSISGPSKVPDFIGDKAPGLVPNPVKGPGLRVDEPKGKLTIAPLSEAQASSIEAWESNSGKRYRMLKGQKIRGLTRGQAFLETHGKS